MSLQNISDATLAATPVSEIIGSKRHLSPNMNAKKGNLRRGAAIAVIACIHYTLLSTSVELKMYIYITKGY